MARDLNVLCASGVFELAQVIPLDMFPHTQHVECVADIRYKPAAAGLKTKLANFVTIDSTLIRRMTTEREVSREKRFVTAYLPWLVATGALAVYLVTLNHWVSLSSLPQVAKVCGWTWQPEMSNPFLWLVTYPLRWLPARMIPLALNLFAAVCAALSLALLARSVALMPHDRSHDQRLKERSSFSMLSIPACLGAHQS